MIQRRGDGVPDDPGRHHALAGFGYPSAPLPIALNITSKILAFVTTFTLFLTPGHQSLQNSWTWTGLSDPPHARCPATQTGHGPPAARLDSSRAPACSPVS
jgi:hypothetical protein